uniref:Vesicle-associated membrane protein 1 n=1 Tax=Hucho hucho TaxID=62062 RepID=A0A4W5Q5Q5_9TELE
MVDQYILVMDCTAACEWFHAVLNCVMWASMARAVSKFLSSFLSSSSLPSSSPPSLLSSSLPSSSPLLSSPLQVVDIMRVNVDKVLERDQKLSELDDRADALQAGASQFESCAAKLKSKYWWKNAKMMIIMGIIGVLVVGVLFLYFFY